MQIDITELLYDADVGGASFGVIRRREVVNTYGEGARTEFNPVQGGGLAIGAVYPGSKNELVREEAYTTGLQAITVVTQFKLRGASKQGGQTFQPDLVRWNGERYIVKVLDPYVYGTGFVVAHCIAVGLVNNAPGEYAATLGQMDFSDPAQSGLIGAT